MSLLFHTPNWFTPDHITRAWQRYAGRGTLSLTVVNSPDTSGKGIIGANRLEETLNADGVRSEAAETLRGLIEEIRLTPDKETGVRKAELRGELGAISALGDAPKKNRPAGGEARRFSLVAEEGLRQYPPLLRIDV